MKKLLSLVLGLGILLAPGLALAANINGYDLFQPSIGDKSIDYLGQVFGTVGGVIHGSNGQLLSKVFEVFNYGMVMIAGFLMIYTIFLSVINTAQEGEFMGKKMNSAWVVFRAVTGIGILVPKYTGYSLVQVFVLWVAVQGVGLADKAWVRALDYLGNEGGVVFAAPMKEKNVGNTLNTVNSVLKSEVCLYKLQNLAAQDQANARQQLKSDPSNPLLQNKANQSLASFSPVWNNDAKTVNFGFKSNAPGSETACGTYSWQRSDQGAVYENYQRTGLEQIVLNLTPAAKAIANYNPQRMMSIGDGNSLKRRTVEAVVGAVADYENIMQPALNLDKDRFDKKWKDNIQDAREKGWIVAGSYYWDLAKLNNEKAKSDNYQPSSTGPIGNLKDYGVNGDAVNAAIASISQYANIGKMREGFDALQDLGSDGMARSTDRYSLVVALAMAPTADQQKALLDKYAQLHSSTNVDKPFSKADQGVMFYGLSATTAAATLTSFVNPAIGPIMALLSGSLLALAGVWFGTMNSSLNGDPIAMIQVLGQGMVGIAATLWIVGSVAIGILTTFLSIGTSATGIGYGIQNSMKLFLPVVLAFILVLFVNGMVLSVYVPMIPFLIFTFAAVGWLISILEAVVAGPLVALGVTHPEGHDLLGKAEQAVMLLMGILLRPIVMVIGFLAAIVLARVTLRIVNAGFSHAVSAANITMYGVNMFGTAGLMIVYTVIVVSLINLVFNAGVVKLWETIWMWVGFHQPSTSVESAVQELKGAVHSGAQGGGELSGGMTRGGAMVQAKKSDETIAKKKAEGDLKNVG